MGLNRLLSRDLGLVFERSHGGRSRQVEVVERCCNDVSVKFCLRTLKQHGLQGKNYTLRVILCWCRFKTAGEQRPFL